MVLAQEQDNPDEHVKTQFVLCHMGTNVGQTHN